MCVSVCVSCIETKAPPAAHNVLFFAVYLSQLIEKVAFYMVFRAYSKEYKFLVILLIYF